MEAKKYWRTWNSHAIAEQKYLSNIQPCTRIEVVSNISYHICYLLLHICISCYNLFGSLSVRYLSFVMCACVWCACKIAPKKNCQINVEALWKVPTRMKYEYFSIIFLFFWFRRKGRRSTSRGTWNIVKAECFNVRPQVRSICHLFKIKFLTLSLAVQHYVCIVYGWVYHTRVLSVSETHLYRFRIHFVCKNFRNPYYLYEKWWIFFSLGNIKF